MVQPPDGLGQEIRQSIRWGQYDILVGVGTLEMILVKSIKGVEFPSVRNSTLPEFIVVQNQGC